MSRGELDRMLFETLGGDPKGHVAQSLSRRRADLERALGLDPSALSRRLSVGPLSPALRQSLLDHLTVGESYFFRGRAAFQALEQRVFPFLRQESGQIRVWSAGCSTGQEVYSLAFSARKALSGGIRLVGTDVNPARLEVARSGVYRTTSSRGPLPEGFARPLDSGFEVLPLPGVEIEFAEQNLVRHPPPGRRSFHLVVCRNTLLYFSAAARQRAFRCLSEGLVPGGFLLLGEHDHLRPGEALPPELSPTEDPCLLRYRAPDRKPSAPLALPPTPARGQRAPARPCTQPRAAVPSEPPLSLLEQGKELLARGQDRDAEALALRAADLSPEDPEPLLLIAEIALFRGEPSVALRLLEGAQEALGSDPRVPSLVARARGGAW